MEHKLSNDAVVLMSKWKTKCRDETRFGDIPTWDKYFVEMAFNISKRSCDGQSHCGCVLTTKTHEILATGYNGFMRDINDTRLPNLRPEKYPWMIHAEHNAILSCARQGKSTLDAIAYVTGEPCIYCLQYLWQAGITDIIHGTNQTSMQDEEMDLKAEIFKYLTDHKLNIRQVDISRK